MNLIPVSPPVHQKITKSSSASGTFWTLVTEYKERVFIRSRKFKFSKTSVILLPTLGKNVDSRLKPAILEIKTKKVSQFSALCTKICQSNEHETKLSEIFKKIKGVSMEQGSYTKKEFGNAYIKTVFEFRLEHAQATESQKGENNLSPVLNSQQKSIGIRLTCPNPVNDQSVSDGASYSEAETEACFSDTDDLLQKGTTSNGKTSSCVDVYNVSCMAVDYVPKCELLLQIADNTGSPVTEIMMQSLLQGKTKIMKVLTRTRQVLGIFAAKTIFKGELVVNVSGDFTTRKAGIMREIEYRNNETTQRYFILFFVFEARRYCIDTKSPPGHGKYVNHSELEPNVIPQVLKMTSSSMATPELRVTFVALRDILNGEEILCNYKNSNVKNTSKC